MSDVLDKSNQDTNEEDITWNARLTGKEVDVQGSILISFCMRGSTGTYAMSCYITKEWDPQFDMIMAKGNLPKELRRSLREG